MTIYLVLAGAGIVVGLVLLYARSQRKLGRSQANLDGATEAAEHAIERNKIDEDVADTSDADLFDELHDNDNK